MHPTFPAHTKHPQTMITASSFSDLEQMARTRGATAGLHGVEDDFETSVESLLHFVFVREYGALGPEPALLREQREHLEEELEHTYKKLYAHQSIRFETTDLSQDAPRVSYRLCLGTLLVCGLAGLGCEALGVEVMWRGWAMLGMLSVLLIVSLQVFPHWAGSVRHYLDHRAMLHRARQIERDILKIKDVEWQETEKRNKRDQFIEPRKHMLVSIFRYCTSAGQCTAHNKVRCLTEEQT